MAKQTAILSMDAFVDGRYMRTNYGNLDYLWTGFNGRNYAFLFARQFWPAGATILSAKIVIYNYDSLSAATRTIVARAIGSSWSAARVTPSTMPTIKTSPQGSITKTTAQSRKNAWEIDVTTIIQAVADGAVWQGFRLHQNGASGTKWVSSRNSDGPARPKLIVEWSDAPHTPDGLSPSGGRAVSTPKPLVRCNFTDLSGNRDLAGIQVRVFNTESAAVANTTPSWESGQVPTTIPHLDLSQTSFPAVPQGAVRYWRVSVQDGAGLWSGWSEYSSFTYQPNPTVTLLNPPGDVVYEATPPILHSVSGGTQVQRIIRLFTANRSTELWSTGWETTTDTSTTVPRGIIQPGRDYYMLVAVRDGVSREWVPGAPHYGVVERVFSYKNDPSQSAPSNLQLHQWGETPSVHLTWERSTAPDAWEVHRDGLVIMSGIFPLEMLIDGETTKYEWTDPYPPARRDVTYTVHAIVNGKSSTGVPTTIKTRVKGIWLMDWYKEYPPLIISGMDKGTWKLDDDSEVFQIKGSSQNVLMSGQLRGYSGTITGELLDRPSHHKDVSSQEMRDRALTMRGLQGRRWGLVLNDTALEVVVSKMNISPTPDDELSYEISFEFHERDFSVGQGRAS